MNFFRLDRFFILAATRLNEGIMSLTFLILMILGSIFVVTMPIWSFSRRWGYYPCSIILVMIVVIAGVSFTNDVKLFF
ncbi:hypothetical protein TH24_19150 [Thalassospira xiamenensis]|uniref:Uncharacterized protein n=2 Tax=Thalassospiraceae TaxID=2844866 RepID=A0ABR4TJ44_9PROT|nr:hypothetical protein SMB34_08480 [Thalassospira permensis NBRC 106175]RCK36197.1 hypothetical protein TH24_19150 [Thalassospira xiamenensis]